MRCRLWASCCFCFFFLVTFLSHRHLALAAVLPTPSSSDETSEDPSSAAYSVAWSSPAPGDRFGSGDTVVGEWQVTPQNQNVVSPSFRFCVAGEDGCGPTIWPEVVQESGGSYYASLTAPSVTTESGYYLQMKDDFGHTYSSPIFNIAPTPQKKNKPHQPDVAQPRPDQAPMSSSPSSSSSTTGTTGTKSKGATDPNPAAAAAAPDSNGILSPPSAASGGLLPPNPAVTPTPGSANGNGPPQVAAAAHNAPPVAAIAVPLSLTGAIILLAGGLALHHRKQLAAEKERAWWSSSSSSWPWNRSPGLVAAAEKAFFSRADRMPDDGDGEVYHRHDRFPEKPAASLYASSYYAPSGSSHACCAPEPRQRTRELDLFTREFTTSTRPRAHAPPSPSPSSYRGFWDRRYTLRRSNRSSNSNSSRGGGGGGGSGTLWRSLSFAARQKKVLPPTPPSTSTAAAATALPNSPTMTVVTTSVTSEVLPSYLPSPQFDGPPTAHASDLGEFAFENVPLSPPLPLPPQLHTRGEAADPEDSRMKELRGVYEAVARALATTHV